MRRGAMLLLWVVLGCASGPPPRPEGPLAREDFSYLEQRVDYEAARALDDGATSLVVSLVDAEGVLFEKAYGLADIESKRRATPQTLYRAGSITKLFTGIAILQLAERGQLDLDAPLVRYLPEFEIGPPPPYLPGAEAWRLEDITLRSMLTHHAGLPRDRLNGFFSSDPLHYRDYVRAVADSNAAAPVGLMWAYSNVAYALLGNVVERVSGLAYATYLQQYVLDPCAMHASHVGDTPEALSNAARAYWSGEVQDPLRFSMTPAGGLYSSASDLSKFSQMALRRGQGGEGRVLDATTLEAMWERQNRDVPLDFDWEMGLSWARNLRSLALEGAGPMVGHDGATLAHRALLQVLPERDLAIVVLSNAREGGRATYAIARLALEIALEMRHDIRQPDTAPAPRATMAADVDRTRLDALGGLWTLPFGALHLSRTGERLGTQSIFLGLSVALEPLSNGRFRPGLRWLDLVPLQPDAISSSEVGFDEHAGLAAAYTQVAGRRSRLAHRIDLPPAPEAWAARAGRYEVDDMGGNYPLLEAFDLYVDDMGHLRFDAHTSEAPFPIPAFLHAMGDDRAFALSLPGGGTLRAEPDGTLRYSDFTLRRVD